MWVREKYNTHTYTHTLKNSFIFVINSHFDFNRIFICVLYTSISTLQLSINHLNEKRLQTRTKPIKSLEFYKRYLRKLLSGTFGTHLEYTFQESLSRCSQSRRLNIFFVYLEKLLKIDLITSLENSRQKYTFYRVYC